MERQAIEVKQIDFFDEHFYKVRYIDFDKTEKVDYFPSVTTKLGALAKPFLMQWVGDLGTREATLRRDEAAEEGTLLHWAWYNYMQGGAVVYNSARTPSYNAEEMKEIQDKFQGQVVILTKQQQMYNMTKLMKFVEICKPVVVANEVIVYDVDAKDAGTCDNIFMLEAGSYMVNGSKPIELPKGYYTFDLKTGKSISKESRMQVCTYGKMAVKMGLIPEITGCLIGHTQAKTKSGIEGFSLTAVLGDNINQEYQDYRDIAKVWDRNFGGKKPKIFQIPSIITRQNLSSMLKKEELKPEVKNEPKANDKGAGKSGSLNEKSSQPGVKHLPVAKPGEKRSPNTKGSTGRSDKPSVPGVAAKSPQTKE